MNRTKFKKQITINTTQFLEAMYMDNDLATHEGMIALVHLFAGYKWAKMYRVKKGRISSTDPYYKKNIIAVHEQNDAFILEHERKHLSVFVLNSIKLNSRYHEVYGAHFMSYIKMNKNGGFAFSDLEDAMEAFIKDLEERGCMSFEQFQGFIRDAVREGFKDAVSEVDVIS